MKKIFQIIIGSEILQNRRKDKHFEFLKNLLLQRGYELLASFIIKNNPKLMEDAFNLIKNTKNSYLFCYGGIGATPDDYTGEIAAKVFTNSQREYNKEFKEIT